MLYRLLLVLSFPVFFLGGCQSVAIFPGCGNGRLETGEECEPGHNEEAARQWCLTSGYSGGIATCDPDRCTYLPAGCTGNIGLECDPMQPEFNCPYSSYCYFFPDTSQAYCASSGPQSMNDPCANSTDCQPGLVCVWNVCSRLCRPGFPCDRNLPCNSGWPEDLGFCPLVDYPCNPVTGGGCPAEHADPPEEREYCTLSLDGANTACLHAGNAYPGEFCAGGVWNECEPGYHCYDNVCIRLCTDLPECDIGETCNHMFVYFQSLGICQ